MFEKIWVLLSSQKVRVCLREREKREERECVCRRFCWTDGVPNLVVCGLGSKIPCGTTGFGGPIAGVGWMHRKVSSGRLHMASTRDRRPSEFGGVPGLTPPPGYDVDAATQQRLERATNPDDATDTAEAARIREFIREGRA